MSQGMFPDSEVANIAMDISINQTITEELPRKDEKGNKCGVYIEDFTEMRLTKDQSTLYYYTEFQKAKEEKKKSKGQNKDSLAGPKGNQKGTSGCKEADELFDEERNSGNDQKGGRRNPEIKGKYS